MSGLLWRHICQNILAFGIKAYLKNICVKAGVGATAPAICLGYGYKILLPTVWYRG